MFEIMRDREWNDKVWGRTLEWFHNSILSMHELSLDKGGRCSIHYHKQRANLFLVRQGKVLIEAWQGGSGSDPETFVLRCWDRLVIPSYVTHRFTALTDGSMQELYWPDRGGECLRDDIVRFKEGYLADSEELSELIAKFC